MPEYMLFQCECNDETAMIMPVVVAIPVVQLDNVMPIAVQLRKFGLSKAYRSQDQNTYVIEQSLLDDNLADHIINRLVEYEGDGIPMMDIDEDTLIELEEKNENKYDISLVINEYDEIYAEVVIQSSMHTLYDVGWYPLDGKLDPNF